MRMLILLVSLLVPFLSIAQTDLSFFPYYNTAVMEDLGVSPSQVESIKSLNASIGQEKKALYEALLYRDDLNAGIQELEKKYQSKLAAILTTAQIATYEQFLEDAVAELGGKQEKYYKDLYLDVYNYLKIKPEQAQQLADFEIAFNDGKLEGDYKAQKRSLLKEVLTDSQWEKYERKNQREDLSKSVLTSRSPSLNLGDMEERLERSKFELTKLKTYTIPERVRIRSEFNPFITPVDREVIEELRAKYLDWLKEIKFDSERSELLDLLAERWKLKQEYVIENVSVVESVVQSDRETFNKAKALGIKFDQQIDRISFELAKSEDFSLTQDSNNEISETLTDKVELYRNIAFLLIPTEYDSEFLTKNIHQLSAFPLPATNQQTIEFETTSNGQVRIDLIDIDGSIVQTLPQENLSAGKHQRKVNLSTIASEVFFYRITDGEGVSLLKSLKMK